MDQDELAKKITQAGDEGWTGLTLAGEGLEYLTPGIGERTNLTYLYLSDNQLTALPPGMKQLIDQGVVKLSGNPPRG